MSGLPQADSIVVVNDGQAYPSSSYPSRVSQVVQHRTNQGVARSKNDALRLLLSMGCKHIFLCEDDIRIVDPELCRRYIQASETSGILHFNFGYHGPRNKSANGKPCPRKIVDYGKGVVVGLNRHSVGAFSYYRDIVLNTCGLLDSAYRNMLDHVDHTYRIIKNGLHPPFWWFADLAESWRYIDDLDPDLSRSTMRYDRWMTSVSFHISNLYFLLKHGCFVQSIPDAGEHEVEEALTRLSAEYGQGDAVFAEKD